MTKPWTYSRGPIAANESDLAKAGDINALLRQPIDVLPAMIGDPIKPFAVGLWNEVRLLLKPDISVTTLRKATGAYIHSKRYFFATAQPDSMRFDLQGKPIEPVSTADRLSAQARYQRLKRSDLQLDPDADIAPSLPSKVDRIRAGLLARRPT